MNGTDAELLAAIAVQEKTLVFPRFTLETAWTLGTALRDAALARQAPVAIDIGLRDRPLFHAALPGAGPDNADWAPQAQHRPDAGDQHPGGGPQAEGVGRDPGRPLRPRPRDHAAHGGGFPLKLEGLGCIGAITISGLPQVEDHALVVEVLERVLGQ